MDPVTITQGSDAPFELDYQPAITSGKAIKRFNREGKFHIAKWTGPGDSIQWRLLVSQTGDYKVRIRYAADHSSQGDHYTITIGRHTINGTVVATGEAYHYQEFDLGNLNIAKAGRCPGAQAGVRIWAQLDVFQALEIAPAGVVAVE